MQGVRNEQSASSSVRSSISKALESGNVAGVKQATRNVHTQDSANVQKALSAIDGAAAKVQAVATTSTTGLG